jgi:hypothetical protein
MQHIVIKHRVIIIGLILLVTASCQKVINLKLNNAAPQLVIEGNLTDQLGMQTVTLSKSVPFTSTNVFPPVTGATVTISDSAGDHYQLTEGPMGTYSIAPLAGAYGETYFLTVETGGKTYTAKSTMPNLVPLDSITAKINSFTKNNLRTITVNYQDPPTVANQYLFVLYVNSSQVGTIFADDDNFTNGRYVKLDLFQTGTNINPGDTATVNMECIDENVFKYWFSLSQQQGNGPGGGTAPSNPPSNINNNALGYFSAHTSQFKSIIVN